MSYDDTGCPCGGKKKRQTMLCQECNETFKDHPSMKVFNSEPGVASDYRRQAAIILLTLSRKRKQK